MTDTRTNPVGDEEKREHIRGLFKGSSDDPAVKELVEVALDGLDIAQEMAGVLRSTLVHTARKVLVKWDKWQKPNPRAGS